MALKVFRLLKEKCRKIWHYFFRKREKQKRILVDKSILPDELCARCVIYPYHVKRSRVLKAEAFMPTNVEDGVSLLRLRYCDELFAFSHGSRIVRNEARFDGLAIVTQNIVSDVNSWAQGASSMLKGSSERNGLSAIIKYAPMKNDHEYASFTDDIYFDDPDVLLPMHAELKYSGDSLGDEIRTRMRQFSRELVKRIQNNYILYQ